MGRASPLVGWDIAALIFCGWIWFTLWPLDAISTAQHALREEPNRDLADLILLGAAIASLAAVGWVLFRAGDANGDLKYLEAGFALVSVFLSWTLVHTVFTLNMPVFITPATSAGSASTRPRPPNTATSPISPSRSE